MLQKNLACFRSPPFEAIVPNAADISLALQPASASAACSARTADRSLEEIPAARAAFCTSTAWKR